MLGVFGGTFDPVHYGHIHLARQALIEYNLDEISVIPANMQPFKQDMKFAPGEHRMKMLELAFSEDERISVLRAELDKKNISYTIDTLREIKKQSNCDISFIIGSDSVLCIEKWKDADELIRNFPFIVGKRPGEDQKALDDLIKKLIRGYNAKVFIISNKQIDISSSEIKEMIAAEKDVAMYLPKAVERYIADNGIYKELY
jgi:nicotinate-nucleotide adenylyltransferase